MDDYDDIVIGSGLAALGTVLGLDARRRVLVLAGAAEGVFSHYDAKGAVPCAYSGQGGLGGYWHGVIPVSRRHDFAGGDNATFAALFSRFYPHVDAQRHLGQSALFVPWRPIRPAMELTQLAQTRPQTLSLLAASADLIQAEDQQVGVRSTAGTHRAKRVWVAAGAVHTPALLARSFGETARRRDVADHVLCYVGQIDGAQAPHTQITRDGVFFPAHHDPSNSALYTLRPARFSFRQLDHGIEQRAAFGLPTGNAIAKIMRSMSPGLLAEAFYNRFGILPRAARYSIYAQTPVDRAYALGEGPTPLTADLPRIQAAAEQARVRQPFAGAVLSRRPDLYIPGIHLHHSVDADALAGLGINRTGDAVQVVDASVLQDIGPEHHSFKMLCAAYQRARQAA